MSASQPPRRDLPKDSLRTHARRQSKDLSALTSPAKQRLHAPSEREKSVREQQFGKKPA